MNILFLTTVPPLPSYSGYQLRCFNIIKLLSQKHRIFLISFVRNKEQEENLDLMKKYCANVYSINGGKTNVLEGIKNLFSILPFHVSSHNSLDMKNLIIKLQKEEKIDVFYSNIIYFGQYISLMDRAKVLTVLDQHNLDRDVWGKMSSNHPNNIYRLYCKLNLFKTKAYENKIYKEFDVCFSVSEQDLKGGRCFSKSTNFVLAPNGVDIEYYFPQEVSPEKNSIIFTGSNAERNIQALKKFYFEIFPFVREKVSDVKFYVVGNISLGKLNFLSNDPSVTITGKVEDVRPYFEKAMVYVSPFTLGGGTKLKILEAMSMKKSIVSTTAGCQGINVLDGENIIIRDNEKEFAESIIECFNNSSLREKLGLNARQLAENNYDWSIIVKEIDGNLKKGSYYGT
ncbi:glycosyltransferase [Paenibacillus radicis (ex Xue et al. 2023)]|uniref:Glycosyltransferase n=1 Tax=Paenibacillus radicis (ex Xue et al. 2023) TaxID=2972489 RepID=A0ABT1YGU6_9BACL|nr:glycosyltransferase [Paenibacillus radicis (ex Xue et al. 2023)]MCR8632411.1 glycosyltransferase [Paenibacillus radicis (ex Xue et al. 2023)]